MTFSSPSGTVRPHLIDFMFHGSGGSDFFAVSWQKNALLRMRTSTNLRRCDAAKKINDIHGVFNAFFFLPTTRITIFAGKSVKHEVN